MLIAWRRDGSIAAVLNYLVRYDELQRPIGLVDFAAHEAAGGRLRDVWDVCDPDEPVPDELAGTTIPPDHPWRVAHDQVEGSGTWPEWVPPDSFVVELEPAFSRALAGPSFRIRALVHKKSGFRRERARIQAAIDERIAAARVNDEAADLRDLAGGPDRPLMIDATGHTLLRERLADGRIAERQVDALGRRRTVRVLEPPPTLPLVGTLDFDVVADGDAPSLEGAEVHL